MKRSRTLTAQGNRGGGIPGISKKRKGGLDKIFAQPFPEKKEDTLCGEGSRLKGRAGSMRGKKGGEKSGGEKKEGLSDSAIVNLSLKEKALDEKGRASSYPSWRVVQPEEEGLSG